MYNNVITLLKIVPSLDQYGYTNETVTRKDVFCKVKSVGMQEHYQAKTIGLKPNYVFVIADYLDYDDEQKVEYKNKEYIVERTYRTGRELEIVVRIDG